MVVSGVPERTTDHAERVGRFAMDIVGQAAQVLSPATGKPLQVSKPVLVSLLFSNNPPPPLPTPFVPPFLSTATAKALQVNEPALRP